MYEDPWIERILARFRSGAPGAPAPGHVEVGDDASVLPLPDGEVPVLTVDAMVDGVHFREGWLTDEELGGRILRVAASDLSAMGAAPRGVLLAIESPDLPGRVGESFWNGVAETLHGPLAGSALLGGNVTRTSGPLSISCTVLGSLRPGEELRRSGARVGDAIWVTGFPGRAAVARRALDRGEPLSASGDCPWRVPPWLGTSMRALAAEHRVTAAIDLSDGLGLDLSRLLRASEVGAVIDITDLVRHAREGVFAGLSPADTLGGGEDYEILFTTDPDVEPHLDDPRTVHRLGTIEDSHRLVVVHAGETIPDPAGGWDPFRA